MGGTDTGPVLDDQARAAYKRRLAEIDRAYLIRELAGALGLGGRHRLVGSSSERARAGVARALRYSIAPIAEHHPELGDHLTRTVGTGTYCCYAPNPRMERRWEL